MLILVLSTGLASDYVLLPDDAWVRVAPSTEADGARRNPAPDGPSDVSIAERVTVQDGWVLVRTLPADPPAPRCHPSLLTQGLALDGWVKASDLATVLTRELVVDGADGASLTIKPGQRVVSGATLPGAAWMIATTVPEDAVGDSYTPGEPWAAGARAGERRFAESDTVLRADTFVLRPVSGLPLWADGDRGQLSSGCVRASAMIEGHLGEVGRGGIARIGDGPTGGWSLPEGTALVRPDGTPAGVVRGGATLAPDGSYTVDDRTCVPVTLGAHGEGGLPICFAADAAAPEEPPEEPPHAGPQLFHHSQLQVKRRSVPQFPLGGAQPVKCIVTITMDDAGVPVAAAATGCPPAFATAAEDAAMRWRWKPPPIDAGEQAQVVIGMARSVR
ncbi:MAG: hypothetical protein ACI8PZ_006676 [Myxococcota bacterium]|jgi:hypothetical protein